MLLASSPSIREASLAALRAYQSPADPSFPALIRNEKENDKGLLMAHVAKDIPFMMSIVSSEVKPRTYAAATFVVDVDGELFPQSRTFLGMDWLGTLVVEVRLDATRSATYYAVVNAGGIRPRLHDDPAAYQASDAMVQALRRPGAVLARGTAIAPARPTRHSIEAGDLTQILHPLSSPHMQVLSGLISKSTFRTQVTPVTPLAAMSAVSAYERRGAPGGEDGSSEGEEEREDNKRTKNTSTLSSAIPLARSEHFISNGPGSQGEEYLMEASRISNDVTRLVRAL